jgi:hypothetical protein
MWMNQIQISLIVYSFATCYCRHSNLSHLFSKDSLLSLLWMSTIIFLNLFLHRGEKPGLVVRAEGSRTRGCGFQSRLILHGCKRC